MEYQDRIIAFIDILGFKNIIDNETPKKIASYISLLKSTDPSRFRMIESKERLDLQITYFSDCIVISYLPDETQNNSQINSDFSHFISTLLSLQYLMIRDHNQTVRGAICQGNLIHTLEFCFGPALVDAYISESKKTIFPRLYIDSALVEKYSEQRNFYNTLTSEGNYFFLDPIKQLFNYLNIDSDCDERCWHHDTWWGFLNYSNMIENGLKHLDENIRQKYVFMAQSYNNYLKIFFDYHKGRDFIMFPNKIGLTKKLEYLTVNE
jgi:hypothetical protein